MRNADAGWSAYLFANNVFDEVAINRVLSSAFGRDIAISAARARSAERPSPCKGEGRTGRALLRAREGWQDAAALFG